MPIKSHLLMNAALHVYRRENSRRWQCSTYLGSLNHRQTTKEVSLAAAQDFTRDWFMERCVEDRQRRRGGVSLLANPVQPLIVGPGTSADGRRRRTPTDPSFEEAANAFTSEFEVITLGERNAGYVKSKSDLIRVHLLPFFGDTALEGITAGKVQEYRAHRQTSRVDPKTGKPKKLARATLHAEIAALPDMSAPYKTSGKVEYRAWVSPEEYKMLYDSLGHTYICLRLLGGADIYQVAKNCRTSVKMIEKYYGRHLLNNIDASAVNVRRARPKPIARKKSGKPKS